MQLTPGCRTCVPAEVSEDVSELRTQEATKSVGQLLPHPSGC